MYMAEKSDAPAYAPAEVQEQVLWKVSATKPEKNPGQVAVMSNTAALLRTVKSS